MFYITNYLSVLKWSANIYRIKLTTIFCRQVIYAKVEFVHFKSDIIVLLCINESCLIEQKLRLPWCRTLSWVWFSAPWCRLVERLEHSSSRPFSVPPYMTNSKDRTSHSDLRTILITRMLINKTIVIVVIIKNVVAERRITTIDSCYTISKC